MLKLHNFIFYNYFLLCAFGAWFGSQFLKPIFNYIFNKNLDISRIFSSGGMPSAHSASVSALAFSIGRQNGFNSSSFAISTLFATIVMYDAAGVRKNAGNQAMVLNKLANFLNINKFNKVEDEKFSVISKLENNSEKVKPLKENLGHKPIEVLAGVVVGIVIVLLIPY